ncbi:PREDICTED: uncharacterized protein LOC106808751 isoform X2 [Priapulus caudatus]|uniref:Uncharacterized protein LOC106808751 isoform X2 n=1 Tax=Priapulus caudatus TaxID=37621 RepID=A0ABM1E4G0_PRICU|nr:PREDICTED: uncharacterized protein LOC106808751 isoform X2 [Priapulus caudatus]
MLYARFVAFALLWCSMKAEITPVEVSVEKLAQLADGVDSIAKRSVGEYDAEIKQINAFKRSVNDMLHDQLSLHKRAIGHLEEVDDDDDKKIGHKIVKRDVPSSMYRDVSGYLQLQNIEISETMSAADITDIEPLSGVDVVSSNGVVDVGDFTIHGCILDNLSKVLVDVHNNADDIEPFNISGQVYVAVAKNDATGSPIYTYVDSEWSVVQRLRQVETSQIQSFMFQDVPHLAVATYAAEINGDLEVEAYSFIYRWEGVAFSSAYRIKTSGARDIEPFTIYDKQYLAVANHVDDGGNVAIESEIFVYDPHEQDFTSFQMLPTYAASDIEFFHIEINGKKEFFLAVANEMEIINGVESPATSVVYKYVDYMFIPFQGFSLTRAVKVKALLTDTNTILLAFADRIEGLRLYEYNGWRFTLTPQQSEIPPTNTELVNIAPIAVFADPAEVYMAGVYRDTTHSGGLSHTFKLSFNRTSPIEDMYDTYQTRCGNLQTTWDAIDMAYKDLESDLNTTNLALLTDDPIVFTGSLTFQGDVVINEGGIVSSPVIESDVLHFNEDEFDSFTGIMDDIIAENSNCEAVDAVKNRSLRTDSTSQIVAGTVQFQAVTMNAGVSVQGDIYAPAINTDVDIERLGEIAVYATGVEQQDFNMDMNFSDIQFDAAVTASGTLDTIAQDRIAWIDGSVIDITADKTFQEELDFGGGLTVNGTVDSRMISSNDILMTSGEQDVTGELEFIDTTLTATAMTVDGTVDGVDVTDLITDAVYYNVPSTITGYKTFSNAATLTNLEVPLPGLIDGVDIVDLDSNAFRLGGQQSITVPMDFSDIDLDSGLTLASGYTLAGLDPAHVVLLNSTLQTITGAKTFNASQQFGVLNMVAGKSIDGIDILDTNKPDLLLSGEAQSVSGSKTFSSDLHIGSSTAGTVNDINLQQMSSSALKTTGNQIVTGVKTFSNVTFSSPITVGGKVDGVSLSLWSSTSISLSSTSISVALTFTQDMLTLAGNLQVTGDVNGVSVPQSFLRTEPLYNTQVSGLKDFTNGIWLNNNLRVTGTVGDIDLSQFVADSLLKDTAMVVMGKKTFTESTTFGNLTVTGAVNALTVPAHVVQLSTNEFIASAFVFNDMVAEAGLTVSTLTLGGLLNGEDPMTLKTDTLYPVPPIAGTTQIVTGAKVIAQNVLFSGAVTCNLVDGVDLVVLEADAVLKNQDSTITGEKTLNGETTIVSWTSTGLVDGEYITDWDSLVVQQGREQTVSGATTFENHVTAPNVVTSDGTINGVDVRTLNVEAVRRMGTSIIIGPVTFLNLTATDVTLVASKTVDTVDLSEENVDTTIAVTITGLKTFTANQTVGNLTVTGYVDGVNIAQLYEDAARTQGATLLAHTLFTGGVDFQDVLITTSLLGTVDIVNVNSRVVRKTDVDQILSGFYFLSNANYAGDITVNGLIDDVRVETLNATYVSVTQSQNIEGVVTFTDVVAGYLNLGTLGVGGLVDGVNITDFDMTVMRIVGDQTITGSHTYTGPTVLEADLVVGGLVDGVDVANNTAQHGADNVFTGTKTFSHTDGFNAAGNVTFDDGKTVHGVDVSQWEDDGVNMNVDTTIGGAKTFTADTVTFSNNIQADDIVDGYMVDAATLLMLSGDQDITGLYTFSTLVTATELQVAGTVDGMNVTYVGEMALLSNKNGTLQTLLEEVTFSSAPLFNNTQMNELLNGVDITSDVQMILDDYKISIIRDSLHNQCDALTDMSGALNETAMLLKNVKEFSSYEETLNAFTPFVMSGDQYIAMAVKSKTCVESKILKYNTINNTFDVFGSLSTVGAEHMDHFEFEGNHYLAVAFSVEYLDSLPCYAKQSTFGGDAAISYVQVYKYNADTETFDLWQSLAATIPLGLKAFSWNGKQCLAVANNFHPIDMTTVIPSKLYCMTDDAGKFNETWDLETYGAVRVDATSIDGVLHIAFANQYHSSVGYQTRSIVYYWNNTNDTFDKHLLPTIRCVDAVFVTTSTSDVLLVLANAQSGMLGVSAQTDVYQYDGSAMMPWVLSQTLEVPSAVDLEVADLMDGGRYLFAVNGETMQSITVYKLGGSAFFLDSMTLRVNYKCVEVSVFTIPDLASFVAVAVDGDFNENLFITMSSDILKVETEGKAIDSSSCPAYEPLEELDNCC